MPTDTAERGAPHRLETDEVLDRFGTDTTGLADDEAARRLDEHGPNRLMEQEVVSAWRILLEQFTSPLVYVLLVALVVTAALGKWSDTIVIGIVLAVNGSVGFWQEYRAQQAVESLMDMVSPTAVVRRDGDEHRIDAADLVPGDVIELREGDVVPADVRLLDVRGLRLDESPLTGESVPVDKTTEVIDDPDAPVADRRNLAFMSTAVTSGEGRGVVVATGLDTEIGRISEQVGAAEAVRTPLEARIDRLAKWITVAILIVAAVACGIGLAMGRSIGDMVELAVALSVSAIPAGLPVVVTVALAIGVSRMAQRHAVIQRLAAVDTLGSCSVIVSDKTGTLTQNRMTVQRVVTGDLDVDLTEDTGELVEAAERDRGVADTLLVGLLCNDATVPDARDGDDGDAEASGDDGDAGASGDPMEIALVRSAIAGGLDPGEQRGRYREVDRVPFRTERRFMATIHRDDRGGDGGGGGDGVLVAIKGAPERIAAMCDRRLTGDGGTTELDRDEVEATSRRLATDGLRVLAMAIGRDDAAVEEIRTDDPRGFVFVGLQGLLDPPRESAVGAVDRTRAAGIRTLMVTGDHAATAAAIGEQVHVAADGAQVVEGRELTAMTDDELDAALADTAIWSRVDPEQKMRIVERLQAHDEVVAVTGDGVNDAPALTAADIGAAMGSGTDVAKEASDMVITDDDFASVYAAVEEGRTAFRNIRMATFFLLSTGAAEVVFILATLLLDWPLPLLAAQILWLNVVTNGIADVALAFERGDERLYRRPPRPRSEGVLDRNLIERLAIVSAWLAALGLGVFAWSWDGDDANLDTARTVTLTAFVLFQAVHVFNCRSQDASILHTNLFSNRILLGGVLLSLAVHVGALYAPPTQELLSVEPLSATAWAVAIAVGATAIVVNEAHKRWRTPRFERSDASAAR